MPSGHSARLDSDRSCEYHRLALRGISTTTSDVNLGADALNCKLSALAYMVEYAAD